MFIGKPSITSPKSNRRKDRFGGEFSKKFQEVLSYSGIFNNLLSLISSFKLY